MAEKSRKEQRAEYLNKNKDATSNSASSTSNRETSESLKAKREKYQYELMTDNRDYYKQVNAVNETTQQRQYREAVKNYQQGQAPYNNPMDSYPVLNNQSYQNSALAMKMLQDRMNIGQGAAEDIANNYNAKDFINQTFKSDPRTSASNIGKNIQLEAYNQRQKDVRDSALKERRAQQNETKYADFNPYTLNFEGQQDPTTPKFEFEGQKEYKDVTDFWQPTIDNPVELPVDEFTPKKPYQDVTRYLRDTPEESALKERRAQQYANKEAAINPANEALKQQLISQRDEITRQMDEIRMGGEEGWEVKYEQKRQERDAITVRINNIANTTNMPSLYEEVFGDPTIQIAPLDVNPYAIDYLNTRQVEEQATNEYLDKQLSNRNSSVVNDVLDAYNFNLINSMQNSNQGLMQMAFDFIEKGRGGNPAAAWQKYQNIQFPSDVQTSQRTQELLYKIGSDPRNVSGSLRGDIIELAESLAINTPGYTVGFMGGPGSVILGLQMAGSAYKEARDSGATDVQALGYAAEQGLEEWATDEILGLAGGTVTGGVLGSTEFEKAIRQEVLRSSKTAVGKLAMQTATNILMAGPKEFAQEYLQYFTENASKKIFLGQDTFAGSAEEDIANAVHAGWIGFLNALVMGASSGAINTYSYVSATSERGANENMGAQTIDDIINALDTNRAHYKTEEDYLKAMNFLDLLESARDKYNRGDELSSFEKGSLANAIDELGTIDYESYSENGYDGQGNAIPVETVQEVTDDQIKRQQFNNLVDALANGADTESVDTSMLNEGEKAVALRTAMNRQQVNIGLKNAATETATDLAKSLNEDAQSLFLEQSSDAKNPTEVINKFKSFAALYRSGSAATEETLAKAREVMTSDQISAVQKAGAVDFNRMFPDAKNYNVKIKNVKIKNVTAGNVTFVGVKYDSLSDGQKLRADYLGAFFSKAIGMDVRFFSSTADENGTYKGANGSFTTINGRPVISFDVNAGMNSEKDWTNSIDDFNTVISTVAHEMTHWAEKYAPVQYKNYAREMVAALAQSDEYINANLQANRVYSFDQIVELQRKKMDATEPKNDGTPHTAQEAIYELVANGSEEMLKGNRQFVEAFSKLDEKTQRTLLDHLKGIFDSIAEFLQKMLDTYRSNSAEANAIRALQEKNAAMYDKLQSMYNDMINTATMNTQIGLVPASSVNGQTENSIRQLGEALGLYVEVDNNNNIIGVYNEKGEVVKHVTTGMVQKTPMGALIDTALAAGTVNQTEAMKQYNLFAKLMDMSINTGSTNMIWEVASQFFYSSVKSNSDPQYTTTIDYGTICAKTQAIITVMSRVMVKNGRGLTREQVIQCYNAVANAKVENGYIDVDGIDLTDKRLSVPCPVCYVFSRWIGVPSVLGVMARGQETFGKDATQKDIDKYYNKLKTQYAEDIKKQKDKEAKSRQKALDEAIKEGNTEEVEKIKNKKPFTDVAALKRVVDAKKSKLETQIENMESDIETRQMKGEAIDQQQVQKELQVIQNQLDELEMFKWVEGVRCIASEDSLKLDPDYDPVDINVLLDMNETGRFANGEGKDGKMHPNWSKSWHYRCTRGNGLGKTILPYSGAAIGDLIHTKRYTTEQNPFIQLHRAEIAGDKKAIAKWEAKAKEAVDEAMVRARAQNLIGGQRFQSTSDFRAEWGLDYMMSFLECQAIGSKVQLYTKVIEAVDFFASVGCEVNCSIMPRNNGYKVLSDGTTVLDFSNITGINFEEALIKTQKYNNVQMILVGINDEHIRLAMLDDRITFIIPWHSSGNSRDNLTRMMQSVGETLTNSVDYGKTEDDKISDESTNMKKRRQLRLDIIMGKFLDTKMSPKERQTMSEVPMLQDLYDRFYNDETADEYHNFLKDKQAAKIFPYEYWDKTKRLDMLYDRDGNELGKSKAKRDKQADLEKGIYDGGDYNGQRFLKYCEDLGIKPRFSANDKGEHDLTHYAGYWKVLIDRKMFNSRDNKKTGEVKGAYHNPKAIDVTGVKVDQVPQKVNSNIYKREPLIKQAVIDTMKALDNKQYDLKPAQEQFQQRDNGIVDKYNLAVQNNDMTAAKEYVRQYAAMKGFTERVFHGTTDFGFTKLMTSGVENYAWSPFFATDSEETANSYSFNAGVRTIKQSKTYEQLQAEYDKAENDLNSAITDFGAALERQVGIRSWMDFDQLNNDMAEVLEYAEENNTIHEDIANDVYDTAESWIEAAAYAMQANNPTTEYDMSNTTLKAEKNSSGAIISWVLEYDDEEVASRDYNTLYYEYSTGGEQAVQRYLIDVANADTDSFVGDTMDNIHDEIDEYIDDIIDKIMISRSAFYALDDEENGIGNYEFYADTTNMLEVDANGDRWNSINLPYKEEMKYYEWAKGTQYAGRPINTRALAEYAKAKGYTGVKIKNLWDNGGKGKKITKPATVYIFFDPAAQLKSADAVTFDDNDKPIPLEDRFDVNNPDFGNDVRWKMRDASITEDRLNYLIEDSGAGSRTDYARLWITSINPTDFLSMTLGHENQIRSNFDEMPGSYGSTVNDRDFMQDLKNNTRNTPVLIVDVDTGEVIGHEGRHRMRALEKAGITNVPITVQFSKDGYWLKEMNGYGNPLTTIKSKRIYNQFGTYQSTTLNNIIPINQSTRDEILKSYVNKDAEIQYKQRDNTGRELSQGQVDYFKDSKVRDANGNLLQLYHWTVEQIDEDDADTYIDPWYTFDLNQSAKGDVQGFYFSSDKSGDYWMPDADRTRRIDAYLNITNPFVMDTNLNNTYVLGNVKPEDRLTGKAFRDKLIAKGYDGIQRKDGTWIAFYPNQIKNIDNLNPTQSDDIRYKQRDDYAPVFYSKLQREVEAYRGEKLGAASVESFLKGKGVKEEEIKWSGIRTFLEGKKSVSKAELLDYLKSNQLQVEELPKYMVSNNQDTIMQYAKELGDKYGYDTSEIIIDDYNEYYDRIDVKYADGNYRSFYSKEIPGATHWHQYSLDGAENYREYLYTLPGSNYNNRAMRVHWDENGVLVHARVDDFSTTDGKRVLFVEEIQSDWHNAGQKNGYDPTVKTVEDLRDESNEAYFEFYRSDTMQSIAERMHDVGWFNEAAVFAELFDSNVDITLDWFEDKNIKLSEEEKEFIRKTIYEESQRQKAISNAPEEPGAPDAPYSKTYTEFVLKNLLRKAAEGGYDYLAWTDSDLQMERWNPERLTNKEMEIRSKKPNAIAFEEGYQNEYDREIPKFLNKYGKQWSAKTEKIYLDNDYLVPAIPITDAMKQSVLYEGQPQFQFRGESSITAEMDKQNLETAKEMFNNKVPMENIRLATGWFRQSDKNWRNEFSDYDAKLMLNDSYFTDPSIEINRQKRVDNLYAVQKKRNDLLLEGKFDEAKIIDAELKELINEHARLNGIEKNMRAEFDFKVFKLPKVLDFPELYKYYPQLEDMDVIFTTLQTGTYGEYSRTLKEINIDKGRSREETLSTLLHEVQHAIQDIEGFPKDPNRTYRKRRSEIEAFDVSERHNYTDEQRQLIAPEKFQDRESQSPDYYEQLIEKYGALPKGEKAITDFVAPKKTDAGNVMRWVRTAGESGTLDEGMQQSLKNEIVKDAMSYQVATDLDATKYATNVLTKNGIDAAQKRWDAVVNNTTSVTKNDLALGEMLMMEYAAAGDTSSVMKMIAEISTEGTRAGQQVQALRLLKQWVEKVPGLGLYATQKAVDKMNQDLEKQTKGKAPKLEINPELADEYIHADTPEKQEAALNKIYQDLGEQLPSTVSDKIRAWRYMAMLLNPRTTVRNFVGNAVFVPAVRTKNLIKAGLETAIGVEERTTGLRKDKKYIDFAVEDYDRIADVIAGESRKDARGLIYESRKTWNDSNIVGKTLNRGQWLEGVLLDNKVFGDKAFLKMHFVDAFARYLTANKTDLTNEQAVERARQYAILEAQKATYRDASVFATKMNQLSRSTKVGELVVEGLLPFKKTPINILKRGVEYSPLGLIYTLTRGTYKMVEASKNGTAAEKSMAMNQYLNGIAAGTTGVGIMAIGYVLAALGLITGGIGDDDRDLENLKGNQQYSVKIGNVTYTIDWAAPAALPFFVGAEAAAAMKGEGIASMNDVLNALFAITEPMFNLSMLSGLNDTLSAVSWTDKNELTSFLSTAILSYLGQFYPTFLGQIARTVDTTRRIAYVDKNAGWPTSVVKFIEKIQNKIPGLSFLNDPYYDQWGRKDVSNPLLAGFENFLSPGYIDTLDHSKPTTTVDTLQPQVEENVVPRTAPKYVGTGNDRVDFTSTQFTTFQIVEGKTAYNIVNKMVDDPRYSQLTPEQQAMALGLIYDYAKYVGRKSVQPEWEPASNKWVIDAREAYQENGTEVYDTILTKAQSKIIEEKAVGVVDPNTGKTVNGSVKRDKMQQILDGPGTAADKGKIYAAMFPEDGLYQTWTDKKYSAADYIKYSTMIYDYKSSTNKRGKKPSQEDVAKFIKKQTRDSEKRKLLWQMADFGLYKNGDPKQGYTDNWIKYMQ